MTYNNIITNILTIVFNQLLTNLGETATVTMTGTDTSVSGVVTVSDGTKFSTSIYRNRFTQDELKQTIVSDVATMRAAMIDTAYSVAQKELHRC